MVSKILDSRFYILVSILIIASFLRLYNLTELPPGLYPDEAMNGNNALEEIATGDWKVFYPENNGREGLFINIQGLFLTAFGNQPWALRLPSAIFGILTVLGVYFLAKKLFTENLALLSSFLMATSFWHINFSRIGFRAIMAPLLLTWGIYFLLTAFRQNKNSLVIAALGGLVYGLGFHTYIAYRATPLLILVAFWFLRKKYGWKPVFKIGFIFTIIAFLTFLPLGIYFFQNPTEFFGRTTQVSIFNSPTPLKDLGANILKTAGMFNFSGDWNWRHNIAGRPLLFWPIGVFFLIGLFFGFKNIIQNLKIKNSPPRADTETFPFPFLILIFWLVIAALPVIISNEGLPHALRAILMAPPIFIISASGGLIIYEFLKKTFSNFKYWVWVRALSFLTLIIFDAYYAYFIMWGQNPNVPGAFAKDYAEIGREINRLPKELPKYIVVEAGGTLVRGIPMPAQTVMFITDTFIPEKQKEKHMAYLLPDQINQIPAGEQNYITYIK